MIADAAAIVTAAVAPGAALPWAGLATVGLLGALLALDDTAYAQTWFSLPLPAALLTGLALGDPLTGLALGLPLQLVLAGNLPVGQSFTGDPTVATVATVGAAVLDGQAHAPALGGGGLGLPVLG